MSNNNRPPRQERQAPGTAIVRTAMPAGVTLWNEHEIAALRATIAPNISDADLVVFDRVCEHTGLDPFAKQIYAVIRAGKMTIQTGIDGYRLIAQRTGQYLGQPVEQWCGEDGKWVDVWLPKEPPRAARVGVLRTGWAAPVIAVALWDEYVVMDEEWEDTANGARRRTGRKTVSSMWAKMPSTMLAKCAEAKALRKAFPAEMAGVYTTEEMAQAGGAGAPDADPNEMLTINRMKGLPEDQRAALRAWAKDNGLPMLADGKLKADEVRANMSKLVAWLEEHEVTEGEPVGPAPTSEPEPEDVHDAETEDAPPAAPAASSVPDGWKDALAELLDRLGEACAAAEWDVRFFQNGYSGVTVNAPKVDESDLDGLHDFLLDRFSAERIGPRAWMVPLAAATQAAVA